MANITITVDEYGQASVDTVSFSTIGVTLDYAPEVILTPDLQTVWDAETNTNKNTFVDANDTEILTFIDADNYDWDWMVANLGRGYNYPQPTGQTTIYRTGDDAWIEANIFTAAVRQANTLKAKNTLADFLTLNNTNAFGNTNRFTDSEGLQDYGATGSALLDYTIDHYTGLGWRTTPNLYDTWNNVIDAALANTEHSFTDWFHPNILHLDSLCNFAPTTFTNYSPFNIGAQTFGSSTTRTSNTLYSTYIHTSVHWLGSSILKTSSQWSLLCRKHY